MRSVKQRKPGLGVRHPRRMVRSQFNARASHQTSVVKKREEKRNHNNTYIGHFIIRTNSAKSSTKESITVYWHDVVGITLRLSQSGCSTDHHLRNGLLAQ